MANPSRHPEGVYAMFFMQMFSMVGFSMLYSLLTLYCTHVLHFPDQRAYDISDAFNDQVFAISILGGYLSGKLLGYRFAFILSACLSILGLALLLSTNVTAFYLGLGMYVLAQGMMVPTMYVLLGLLYDSNDPRRDSGFIISYIGMNVGSFFASLFSGPISMKYGYWAAFFVGLFFAIVTLINYLMFQYKFKPARVDKITSEQSAAISSRSKLAGFLITLLSIPAMALLMDYPHWNNLVLTALGIIGVLLVVSISFKQDKTTRNKMVVFLILSILGMTFWALYLLAPTVLPLFTERNIDRHLLNGTIPTASFSSLNPFYIMVLGPLLSYVWLRLSQKNIMVSTPSKFSTGIILMGTGYLLLGFGIYFHNALGLIGMLWLVGSYFLQTVGELFVGPIGYAMVGSLVPKTHEGLMMGIWQLFVGVAGVFTDYLSKLINTGGANITNPLLTNHAYQHTFYLCGSVTVSIGILLIFFVPWLKRLS